MASSSEDSSNQLVFCQTTLGKTFKKESRIRSGSKAFQTKIRYRVLQCFPAEKAF